MTRNWEPFGYRVMYGYRQPHAVSGGPARHHAAWNNGHGNYWALERSHAWSAFCIQWIVIGACATMLADVWEGGRRERDIDQRDINPENRSDP